MIVESAQLLSTAHRVLDGKVRILPSNKRRSWVHPDPALEEALYKTSHVNHPGAIWIRETRGQYKWLYQLFAELSAEYEHRYKKVHSTWRKLGGVLQDAPWAICGMNWTREPPQCMPEQYKVVGDPIQAYRNYYIGEKVSFARYTGRNPPGWLVPYLNFR